MQKMDNIPTHVAIIMDGNGRWATREGVEKVEGHKRGVDSLRNAVKAANDWGVKFLTVYAFSTENWGRPADEVKALMELFSIVVIREAQELAKAGIRLSFIGAIDELSTTLQEQIEEVSKIYIEKEKMTLVVAMNYSARWDIVNAAKKMVKQSELRKAVNRGVESNRSDVEEFSSYLSTSFMPDVDLVIRTSSEQRLSNFMLWESAYAELYFTDKLWPDFSKEDFAKALEWYNGRQRRFGIR